MNTPTFVVFILGSVLLPIAVAFVLIWTTPTRERNDLIFSFACFGAMLGWMALFVVWTRRGYGRKCQQMWARSWRQVPGRFDDGEIVPMQKGRSGKIAGYQVWLGYEYLADAEQIGWLGYEYLADAEQIGLYMLPFIGEFPSEEVAESYRKRAANREIVVRVSPRNPKRSCVLDEDVRLLIGQS